MRLIQDADSFLLTNATDDFNLLLQLAFGVSAIKLRVNSKLVQQALVEPPRCQLGIGKIQNQILLRRQH